MPSPITAYDLVSRALRKIGVLADGETPDASMANDALAALNDVLETWSIEGLTVTNDNTQQFMTIAGQSTYTMGPGGNWDTVRPVRIDDAYTIFQGVSFPIGAWSLAQYDAVAVKTQQQQIVERLVYLNTSPLAQVILYPVPQVALPIVIAAPGMLDQVPALATTLSLPPGYVRALQYAVGVELMSEYASPIDVTDKARATKALIKRSNRTPSVMQFDATLVGNGPVVSYRGY